MNTERKISIEETSQDFSLVAKMAETNGSVVIYKDGNPRFMLTDLQSSPVLELTDEEKIEIVAKRVLKKYRKAFEELAK